MSERRVLVVGAGVAGLAAAWAATQRGAAVSVAFDRPGASSCYSGAVDLVPWHERAAQWIPVEGPIADFCADLKLWQLPEGGMVLATQSGQLRTARGGDPNLLNLASHAGLRIGLPELGREGWDAVGLARAYNGSAWARDTRTRFEAIEVAGLRETHERRIPSYDLAELHDDEARQRWLAGKLGRIQDPPDVWLFGPWLGLRGVAAALSQLVGRPVGESTHVLEDPAGARLDAARDALLEELGVEVWRGEVQRVRRERDRWLSRLEAERSFDAVVLAVGGLAAGGLVLLPSPAGHAGGRSFRLSLEAPVAFDIDGHDVDAASSLHGIDFEALGRRAVERVGVTARENGAVPGQSGLFVAGGAMAARPRTVLDAAHSGIVAGAAASGE